MSWYSVGAEAADQVAASMAGKKRKNFFTKPGERATIRFLAPATKSFNYKRCFVKSAPGEKMLTSPQTVPDPFVEAGLQLQAAFGWWIIDRRILKFKDQQTGEEKEVGPRVLYFADGQRTRKQLIGFEKDQLVNANEDRAEESQDALDLEEFNLTNYDLTVSKESKAPWNLSAKRPKDLSKADHDLIEKTFGVEYGELTQELMFEKLAEELAPLPMAELRGVLKLNGNGAEAEDDAEPVKYSYDSEDDTLDFDDD